MPKRCMAGGCSRTAADDVGLHFWPKEETQAKLWDRFMKLHRSDWKAGVSNKSVLCSIHFEEKWFDPTPSMKKKMGFKVRNPYMLLPGAVPTIAAKQSEKSAPVTPEVGTPQTKKKKGAYEKRERRRVLAEMLPVNKASDAPAIEAELEPLAETPPELLDAPCTPVTTAAATHVSSTSIALQTALPPPRKYRRSKMTQTPKIPIIQLPQRPQMVNVETQTEETHDVQLSNLSKVLDSAKEGAGEEGDQSEAALTDDDEDLESDYNPMDETGSEEEDEEADQPKDHQESCTRKYLVYETSLRSLLLQVQCSDCHLPELHWCFSEIGSAIVVKGTCQVCGGSMTWASQPKIGTYFEGNLRISSAILYSGCRASKVVHAFHILDMASIQTRTFYRHQRRLLLPAIDLEWRHQQQGLFDHIKAEGEECVVGGDGRADTPGHCAKYGTYTIMDLKRRQILDLQLVQSNEVGGSYHMELEGLKRCLLFLKECNIAIEAIVTDRHKQIAKWLREEQEGVTHYTDIWHCAKGNSKKWEAAAKLKSCAELGPWIRSMTNHLYWAATSTPGTDEASKILRKAKWTSIGNHVMGKHTGHGAPFNKCAHRRFRRSNRDRDWIKRRSAAADKVEELVFNKYLLKDIETLSPHYQTYDLEAFHSLINQFAPKMTAFHFHAMNGRVLLAVLHFNENSNRGTQLNRDGTERHSMHYPKYRKGDAIVRKVKTAPTYVYVENLIQRVDDLVREGSQMPLCPKPPTLASQYPTPEKQDLIDRHRARFI